MSLLCILLLSTQVNRMDKGWTVREDREERGKEKKKRGCLAAAAPVTNAVQKTPNLDTIEREKRHAMVIGRKGA